MKQFPLLHCCSKKQKEGRNPDKCFMFGFLFFVFQPYQCSINYLVITSKNMSVIKRMIKALAFTSALLVIFWVFEKHPFSLNIHIIICYQVYYQKLAAKSVNLCSRNWKMGVRKTPKKEGVLRRNGTRNTQIPSMSKFKYHNFHQNSLSLFTQLIHK